MTGRCLPTQVHGALCHLSAACCSVACRDLIADSIETVMSAQWYDANVSLPGCDKNMPGSIIAMARLNRPSIMVYGGTIKPGYSQLDGSVLDIVSAFQSYGESLRAYIGLAERVLVVGVEVQLHGPGLQHCGQSQHIPYGPQQLEDACKHKNPAVGAP
eukprot:GHRQ01029006.1.p1 GENE.GHRQ01029006.1~~GHRQ01029006.1.p1  ORF type:complete len:158 (-),score=23.23 GHRQ01029006.1:327-800(-)